MIKKTKIWLGSLSMIAAISIIPVVAISCSSYGSGLISNVNKTNASMLALQKLNISAYPNTTITASQAYGMLSTTGSSNLSALANYFDIQSIETAATTDGVTASYVSLSTSSPGYVNPATSNILQIGVTIQAGTGADISVDNQIIKISNFPTTTQATANAKAVVTAYIASINALTGDNTIKALSATTALPTALTNANYTQSLVNVPVIPSNSGITLTFALSSPNATTGTVNIVITASTLNATALASNSLTVTGFQKTS